MPPRRQPSTRSAVATSETTQAAKTTRIPTRRTRTAALPEPADDTANLTHDLNELTIETKGKRAEDKQTVPAKTTVVRRSRAKADVVARSSSEVLVEELTTKLTITPKSSTVEEQSLEAMRAVNGASKSLSGIIESGWTISSSRNATAAPRKTSKTSASVLTISAVTEHYTTAKVSLQTLRRLRPCNLDVERAASSMVSKLINLEMYDRALEALVDMYPSIISLYSHDEEPRPSSETGIPPLSLPNPSSPHNCDEVLLTLLSTYLLHSLAATSYTLFNDTSKPSQDDVETFCDALDDTKTLVSWLPFFKALPSKHLDSILTRAYTALAKSSQTYACTTQTATSVYRIRVYSILCLAHTSSGVLNPDTFWNQTVKFTVSFVKDSDSPPESEETAQDAEPMLNTTETICATFAKLVDVVATREDAATFMSGRGFIAFCEYWTSFAKRMADMRALERIRELIHGVGSASPSTPVSDVPKTPAAGMKQARQRSQSKSRHGPVSPQVVEAAQLYALFIEATALLEQSDSGQGTKCLVETLDMMDRAIPYLRTSFTVASDVEDDGRRCADKVKRSFERLRRVAVKALEALGSSGLSKQEADTRQQLVALLKKGVDILEVVMKTVTHHDLSTTVLDSLFTLARTTLSTSNPTTFTEAYDFLSRSASLVSTKCSGEDVLLNANLVRCISGAYHNLAATLYQATRYDFAVRFLNQSCTLGELALKMYRTSKCPPVDEKSEESWSQLEDQMWRRWEILGVCHTKTEDRKHAFQAFIGCVKAFPFHRHDVLQLASGSGTAAIFTSPQLSHIGEIVDRLTYGGLCDLYMEAKVVSLKTYLKDVFIGHEEANLEQTRRTVIGALLERQIESLEGSKWKLNIRKAIDFFIAESLEVYDAACMPVRRARMLLKSLEMTYHMQDGADQTGLTDKTYIGDVAVEADRLLTTERLQWDEPLAHSQPYYRAILKLWLALLVHRSAQTSLFSRVVSYADEACSILKVLTSTEHRAPVPKESPTQTRGGRKTATRPQATATRTAGRTRARAVKSSAVVVPITPKRKTTKTALAHVTTPVAKPGAEQGLEGAKFAGIAQLVDLLRTTAQLLGLLGQVITKVRLLLQARRICERLASTRPDDFVKISVDLAHEYVKLGKTEKGGNVYKHTLSVVKDLSLSEETRVFFFLRYSESLATTGNVLKSSSAYCEAYNLSDGLPDVEKGMSTVQRVMARSAGLERGAIAASTFANIQYSRDEPAMSIDGLLQSLRLWNRALDTLARLAPPPPSTKVADDSDNPFLSDEAKAATSQGNSRGENPAPAKKFQRPPTLNGLEWRIAEGLLGTLFSLVQAYLSRGSPREAEYFAQQAKDLAESLRAPAMASRALARVGEIQLHLGSLEESHASLTQAAELAVNTAGPDAAEISRLLAEHSRRSADDKEAQQLYAEAMSTLEELDNLFVTLDTVNGGPRKSLGAAPQVIHEAIAPEVLVAILRQNIWLLHGEGEEYQSLLERFSSITASAETKAEQDALLAKLSLDDVYSRFQADMFLSSLTESTITLPMGIAPKSSSLSAGRQDILSVLGNAEKLFWSDLALVARRGRVFHVRDAAVSLALIRAFQVSLGRTSKDGPIMAASLLDTATAITLRREMLEVVRFKFPEVDHDDLQWPLITSNGSPLPPQKSKNKLRFNLAEDSDEDVFGEASMKGYWEFIKKKYEAYACDAPSLSKAQSDELPHNWTVVNISVTDDKKTMFVSRQQPGRDPLIVCIPLKGRRDNDEEEQLAFDDALLELKEIIQLSDEGTRQAASVKNDRVKRAAWWADRSALDKRLKELLENIEFCWLGAFKAILSPPVTIPEDLLVEFRTSIEQIFERSTMLRDKRQKNFVRLEDTLVECFATIPPKCRDEELEDIVYFILDLYQFHGVPVASAEVDIDQAVIDVRAVLEDFAAKTRGRLVTAVDPHMFLVLDKNVQDIPWESIPSLRGRSISRIPSMDFLLDRLQYAKMQEAPASSNGPVDRVKVDPRKVFYVLNPSGDLKNTEGRFVDWLKDMKQVGWSGVTGRAPSEQQLADALGRKDLVLYFGHGGAEQYIRSRKVRHLPRCAATMLWGCSSGALKEMGDFDRTGTPYNYMLAGCPTLVANLWDVTDRDIDKFAQSVFDKMNLNAGSVRSWREEDTTSGMSVVNAVGQSRESCKLKYLTGAAPVIYGIPFYL